MGESDGLPPKKDVMLALLEGPSVFVHLDPRRGGVIVPKGFTSQPQLVLQVGLNMAVRIPDLEVGDEGVSCTLSFNRSPFWCFMPWTAIYGLVGEDGRGMIWPDDVPNELVGPSKPRPRLEAVSAPAPAARSDEEATPPAKPARRAAKKAAVTAAEKPAKPRARGGKRATAKPTAERTAAKAVRPTPAAPAPNGADDEIASVPESPRPGKRPLPPYLRVVK